MALIKCKECGKEISDKATACPHCGCPVQTTDEAKVEVQGTTNIKTADQQQINSRICLHWGKRKKDMVVWCLLLLFWLL